MNLDRARAIADAVVMEGYALYPYRASSPKNRFRWTLGVLAPRGWSEAGGCEAWWLETQFLVAGFPSELVARVRFFQIERIVREEGAVWDEGVLRSLDVVVGEGTACVPFSFAGGRVDNRERCELAGAVVSTREAVDSHLSRVTLRIENRTPWAELEAPRDRVMIAAFASTHLVVGLTGGALLSATDPPDWASAHAAQCTNTRCFPVLVGAPGSSDLLIAAPFIMQDHPHIAPESAGDLCDATEIDEILTLRTQLLTDDEKREARMTDPRAAAIVDRADGLSDERYARMHGTLRDVVDGEMVPVRGVPSVGAKVRLLAPKSRTDAQDALYAGHVATVVEIREDVDGTVFVGITVDDDPAAELHRWFGRCHYYRLDEVEVL